MSILDSATYLKDHIISNHPLTHLHTTPLTPHPANTKFLYGCHQGYTFDIISTDVSIEMGHPPGTKTNLYLIAYHMFYLHMPRTLDYHPDFQGKPTGLYRGQKFFVIAWASAGNNRIGVLGRLLQFTKEMIGRMGAFTRWRVDV